MKVRLPESKIRKIIREEIENLSSPSVSLEISENLERCLDLKDVMSDFCNYAADNLKIDRGMVKVKVVDNRDKSGIRTTAFYNPNNHRIVIYGKNRAIVDICRSIAHEMTHMQQMLEDRISFPVQDAGGEIEDEANAKAGEIIKLFAKSDPKRRAIYESKNKKYSF